MKRIITIILLLGVIGGAYGFYLYNKPSEDVSNKKVDVTLSAGELVNAFKENETNANSKYLNNVILVSGVVNSVNTERGIQNIMIETEDIMSSVICEMSKPTKSIKKGDRVEIKGNCAGYLFDVVLTKCVIYK